MSSAHRIPERSPIPKRDPLWPLTDSLGVCVLLMIVFYLGVLITMLAYQRGLLEVIR